MGCCGWKLAVIVATLAALPALWMWYQRESDFNKGIMPLLTPAENRLYSYVSRHGEERLVSHPVVPLPQPTYP